MIAVRMCSTLSAVVTNGLSFSDVSERVVLAIELSRFV